MKNKSIKNFRLISIGIGIIFLLIFIFVPIRFISNTKKTDNTNISPSVIDGQSQSQQLQSQIISSRPINIDDFFDNIVNYDPKQDIEIVMTGDVMLGRAVNVYTREANDFNWPFKNVQDHLQKYSLVVTNLENPLTKDCKSTLTGMIFCGDQRHVDGLKNANIKVLSLANNHSLNHGNQGLLETVNILQKNELVPFGMQNPVFYEHGNYLVAFLGYDDIECNVKYIECLSEENILADLEIAKTKNPDLIIVVPHWGVEYTSKPTQRQKRFAKFMIDNGVDAVLGNHPHWFQSAEIYKEKLIVYSHGNFIFDQMWSEGTKQGILGRYIFTKNKIVDGEFIPIYIKNYGQANIATDKTKDTILKRLKSNSNATN